MHGAGLLQVHAGSAEKRAGMQRQGCTPAALPGSQTIAPSCLTQPQPQPQRHERAESTHCLCSLMAAKAPWAHQHCTGAEGWPTASPCSGHIEVALPPCLAGITQRPALPPT